MVLRRDAHLNYDKSHDHTEIVVSGVGLDVTKEEEENHFVV